MVSDGRFYVARLIFFAEEKAHDGLCGGVSAALQKLCWNIYRIDC
jgi:hypothetical protein